MVAKNNLTKYNVEDSKSWALGAKILLISQ